MKKKNVCPNCQKGRLERGEGERTKQINGYSFTATLPAQICPVCDTKYYAEGDVGLFEARVAVILADAGIKKPEVLHYLRKVLGLREKDLAALLGVKPIAVSQWESGQGSIPKADYALLRQLLHEERDGLTETADALRGALKTPKKLPKKMRIDAA